MALPGTSSPPNEFPKDGTDSKRKESPGAKCKSEESLMIDQPAADVGPAPTSRIYTRDYSKKGRDPDQSDLIKGVLGNPLRL